MGVDLGTSGARLCVIDEQRTVVSEASLKWAQQALQYNKPADWVSALERLVSFVPTNFMQRTRSICVSGTSASAFLYDTSAGTISRGPLMYDYSVLENLQHGDEVLNLLKGGDSAYNSPTSTLAKLLTWHLQSSIRTSERLLHQADYVSSYLRGRLDSRLPVVSDWHNALKLGFDLCSLLYPVKLKSLLNSVGVHMQCLPTVVKPGTFVGTVDTGVAKLFGLNPACRVMAGTTDSIAAFIASGANLPGQAVTSLGSTLSIKALSKTPVEDAKRGVYSHRWSESMYLVGGASNVGCAVLRQEGYTDEELNYLMESGAINAFDVSEYTYYPLVKTGERFPVCDPLKMPVLDPKPLKRVISSESSVDGAYEVDRGAYLQALLQSIAEVEQQGYAALEYLGATPITEVMTSGGGAVNNVWTAIDSVFFRSPSGMLTMFMLHLDVQSWHKAVQRLIAIRAELVSHIYSSLHHNTTQRRPHIAFTGAAMEVMSEEYDGAVPSECMLNPGEALLNCDGQDIAKKGGGKGRNRVLTILPFQFGVGNKITDCMLGNLRKFSTDAPELVIETENGTLVFPGKFEFPSTKFLAILCQPSNTKKTGQSALTDVFDRVLVFGKPNLVPSAGSSSGRQVSQSSISFNEDSQCSQESTITETGAAAITRLSAHHGVSSLADPIKPSTAKRLAMSSTGNTASVAKAARVKSAVVARTGPSSASKASPTKRSRKISSGSSTEGSGSDSDGSGGSSSSGLSIQDDSASDAEDEVGGAVGGDSPVDRRSSSRRASASKPVNYRVDDVEESDGESSRGSSSGSDSGTEESVHSDNIMDVSSDDEVQIVSKPAMKRTNSTASSISKASVSSQPTPTQKKTTPAASAKKSATVVAKKPVAKVPVARKLADSSTKRKSSSTKASYFSDSDDESAGGSRSSQSDGEQSSQLGGDSSAESSEDSDYSEDSGRKAKKPKLSQPSPSKKSATASSSSAAKKTAPSKVTAKGADAAKATSPKKKTPSKAAATASSTKASAVKSATKSAVKSTVTTTASTGAAAKKRAAAVPPKRKASAALDSDVEVISIDDDSSDEDYSD